LFVNDEYLATFAVSKKGVVRIKKSNKLGKVVIDAMDNNEKISFVGA
jgi:predicted PilT family ATPase